MISFVELVDETCPTCGQKISPLELIIADDGTVKHETQEDEWGGHLLPLEALRAQLDRGMTNRMTNRESGDSISAGGPVNAQQSAALRDAIGAESPLLNKSGGPDVPATCPRCGAHPGDFHADGNKYPGVCPGGTR